MERKEVTKKILELVGGAQNVVNAWHCMTRLRFELKNKELIQQDEIKQLEGVMGIQYAKDQLQIVLGTSVHKYYDILMEMLDMKEGDGEEKPGKKKDFISWFMDMVSGVFGPIVPAIAGAGMIKGLIGGLVALGVITNTTDTYKVIDMLASGVFTFLPFFLAVSAAKKFKTNEYLAVAIASVIMFPTMVDAAKDGEISSFLFCGVIPVPVFNYTSSVIPIIFGVFALSYIHKWVDKMVPEVARTVVTPTLTILISGFFTLTVIGPVGIYMGKGIAWVIDGLFGVSPLLAGLVVGFIRPVSILVGMHHAMTPIALENFATKGWDMLMPMMFITNLAIVGAACACYFKEKTKREKSIVISSVLSGVLGITEPALFGILTKYKKGFFAATIASTIGSAFISIFGVRLYGYITSSVFSIPAYIGPYFVWAALGWILTLVLSFGLSYLFVVKFEKKNKEAVLEENMALDQKDEVAVLKENAALDQKDEVAVLEENAASDKKDRKAVLDADVNAKITVKEIIGSPLSGQTIPLSEVNDPVFSEEMMGQGGAVIPENGIVKAPFDGKIENVFETGHAIGLISDTGVEVLIHVGLDTVMLKGKHFTPKKKSGDIVKKGDVILEFDLNAVKEEGYDPVTPVLVTNTDAYKKVNLMKAEKVNSLDELLLVEK